MAPIQPLKASEIPFVFPQIHSFPPFFSLQPNLQTRTSQLRRWSRLIQRYCRHNHIFKLSLTSALDTPLFKNTELRKRLSLHDAWEVIDWMTREEGGMRAEWIERGKDGGGGKGGTFWVFWKRPEEWGDVLAEWVEEVGQKNTVLTLYELREGDMTSGREFYGMDGELFQRSLNVLVKKGKAQIFGSEDQQGVKFF